MYKSQTSPRPSVVANGHVVDKRVVVPSDFDPSGRYHDRLTEFALASTHMIGGHAASYLSHMLGCDCAAFASTRLRW